MKSIVLEKEFPKIGETIEKFIAAFGQPTNENPDTLYNFDVTGGNTPFLLCTVIDGVVTNISWEPPFVGSDLKKIAAKFLPEESKKLKENEQKILPLLNGDEPTSVDLYLKQENGKEYSINFMVSNKTFTIDLIPMNQ